MSDSDTDFDEFLNRVGKELGKVKPPVGRVEV
jgi:hypothetical protein